MTVHSDLPIWEHLSASTDLSELGPAVLPLDREESPHDRLHVVRVRLRTAACFIMGFESRVRNAPFPLALTATKKVLDNEAFRESDAFAEKTLAEAEKNGNINRNWHMWEAVGEPFYPQGITPSASDEGARTVRRW